MSFVTSLLTNAPSRRTVRRAALASVVVLSILVAALRRRPCPERPRGARRRRRRPWRCGGERGAAHADDAHASRRGGGQRACGRHRRHPAGVDREVRRHDHRRRRRLPDVRAADQEPARLSLHARVERGAGGLPLRPGQADVAALCQGGRRSAAPRRRDVHGAQAVRRRRGSTSASRSPSRSGTST